MKEFLQWAIPCMTHAEIYGEEKKRIIKNVWPIIKEKVYDGLRTGRINERILKYWYRAYPLFKENVEKNVKNPMKEYMFNEHNDLVIRILKIDEKIRPCLALVGKVVRTNEDNVFVNILGREKRLINSCNAEKHDFVGVHIGEAVEVLENEDFNKYQLLMKKVL